MAKSDGGALLGVFGLFERLSVAMAYISGLLLTLLSFFIAADVLGRGSGKFYSGATDEISGFVMTLAVTWALAYTLTIDKHVRVDLLLGRGLGAGAAPARLARAAAADRVRGVAGRELLGAGARSPSTSVRCRPPSCRCRWVFRRASWPSASARSRRRAF